MIRRLIAALVLASCWMIVIPGIVRIGRDKPFLATGGWLWVQLAIVVALAAAHYWMGTARLRAMLQGNPSEAEAIRTRERQRLTGPGWFARYARYGVLMGLAVGIPVGAMLAFGLKPDELPFNSRVAMELIFIGATMCWTLPASFGFRWMMARGQAR